MACQRDDANGTAVAAVVMIAPEALSISFQDASANGRRHARCTRRSLQIDLRSGRKPANLFRKELRLFPGRIVSAFFDIVVIGELAIRPFYPTARRLIVFAGKDTHGGRDGNV